MRFILAILRSIWAVFVLETMGIPFFEFAQGLDYGSDDCYSKSSLYRASTTEIVESPASATLGTILFETKEKSAEFVLRCLHVYETPPYTAAGDAIFNPYWSQCTSRSEFQVCSSEVSVFSAQPAGSLSATFDVSGVQSTCTNVTSPYTLSPLTTTEFGYPSGPELYWRVQFGAPHASKSEHCYPYWVHFVAMVGQGQEKTDGEAIVWIIVVCVAVFIVLVVGIVLGLVCFSDGCRRFLKLPPRQDMASNIPPHYQYGRSSASPARGAKLEDGSRDRHSIDSFVYAGQDLPDIPPAYENINRGVSVASIDRRDEYNGMQMTNFSPTQHVPRAAVVPHSAEKRIDYDEEDDTDKAGGGGYSPDNNATNNNFSNPRRRGGDHQQQFSPSGASVASSNLSRHVQLGPSVVHPQSSEYSPVWSAGRVGKFGGGSPTLNGTRLDDEASFQAAAPSFFSHMLGGVTIGGDGPTVMGANTSKPLPPLPNTRGAASQSPMAMRDPSHSPSSPLQRMDGAATDVAKANNGQPSLYDEAIANEIYGKTPSAASSNKKRNRNANDGGGGGDGSSPPSLLRSPWLDVVAQAEAGAGGTIMLTMADDDDDDDHDATSSSPLSKSTVGIAGHRPQNISQAAHGRRSGGGGAGLLIGGGGGPAFGGGELRKRNHGTPAPVVSADFNASPSPNSRSYHSHSASPQSGLRGGAAQNNTNGTAHSRGTSPMFDEEVGAASPERLSAARYKPAGHVPPPQFGDASDYYRRHDADYDVGASSRGVPASTERSRQYIPPPPMPNAAADSSLQNYNNSNTMFNNSGNRKQISFAEDNPPPVASPPYVDRGTAFYNPSNFFNRDESSGSASPPRNQPSSVGGLHHYSPSNTNEQFSTTPSKYHVGTAAVASSSSSPPTSLQNRLSYGGVAGQQQHHYDPTVGGGGGGYRGGSMGGLSGEDFDRL